MAGGRCITREDIEKRKPLTVSDMLATIPGLEVAPSPRGLAMKSGPLPGVAPQSTSMEYASR